MLIERPNDGGEDPTRYVSPSYLARYWDVHVNTIYRDIRKGALPASRLPGGQFRIAIDDARRYGRPVE
jgi:excisionase family DNA binding protein